MTGKVNTGMVVAPHVLAAEAGADILRTGGNAVEAAVAMAAALSVVYPHMTGLGGDGFWLLSAPGEDVSAIDGAGRSAAALDTARYAGLEAIPYRGALAANTVAGAVSAWAAALDVSRGRWDGRLPLARILEPAIHYAEAGFESTASQVRALSSNIAELAGQPGFASVYLEDERVPAAGALQRQPALAQTLRRLGEAGPEDFYRGQLAAAIAQDLAAADSPVSASDLAVQRADIGDPLALALGGYFPAGTLYTTGTPTQGLATLLIVGQYAYRPGEVLLETDADHVHFLVEATKQALALRDQLSCVPSEMDDVDFNALLAPKALYREAHVIDMAHAVPWSAGAPSDTTWFGAIDAKGRAVSAIQSLYHEFGSGVVLPATGICWHNRGASFSLDPRHPCVLRAGAKPFHTLCPSLVRLKDGRTLVCGTMGGDGQPQIQAALISHYLARGKSLAGAVDAPRWLLGRTWGVQTDTLKLERRFGEAVIASLRERGHDIEILGDYEEAMGHAGIIERAADGSVDGAADPRSDGAAIAG